MKKRHHFALIIPFFALMCASAPSVIVSGNDNAKEFSLKKGEIVLISLDAQLSTGYGWQVSSISGVEQYGDIDVKTAKVIGGIDTQNIRFRAVSAGSGLIELKYIRPWKKDDTPLKYFKVHLSISE